MSKPPPAALAAVTLVVADYDQAIAYFCDVLGFDLVEDMPLGAGKRWVLVAPPGARETRLLLARAANPTQEAAIGHQVGGRVAFFLRVADFDATYRRFLDRGVRFLERPRSESYGRVAVFEDLCGNRWDLLGLPERSQALV